LRVSKADGEAGAGQNCKVGAACKYQASASSPSQPKRMPSSVVRSSGASAKMILGVFQHRLVDSSAFILCLIKRTGLFVQSLLILCSRRWINLLLFENSSQRCPRRASLV
jgi:hypothetical protein